MVTGAGIWVNLPLFHQKSCTEPASSLHLDGFFILHSLPIFLCKQTMPWKQTEPASSITDGLKTVGYAKNHEGKIEQVQSDGYQPVNEANSLAWQEIERQIDRARTMVISGQRSRLYYYMVMHQMDVFLLARYSQIALWRVFIHLYPYFFRRASTVALHRYAELFQIAPVALRQGELMEPVFEISPRP